MTIHFYKQLYVKFVDEQYNLKIMSTNKIINIILQTTPECSSPQLISITGSFLMKKWLGMLSAKLLLPYVKIAPDSEIKFH